MGGRRISRAASSFVRAAIVAAIASLASALAMAAEPVYIALNIPLSGAFSNIGEFIAQSAPFAVDAVNTRGGVLNGRRFELVPFGHPGS